MTNKDKPSPHSGLADELRLLRSLMGETLRAVQQATGISNAYLSQLESGKVKKPSPDILYKLAQHYQVAYEWLMKLSGYPTGIQNRAATSVLQTALLSANLTPEEEKKVIHYITFLCHQRQRRTL